MNVCDAYCALNADATKHFAPVYGPYLMYLIGLSTQPVLAVSMASSGLRQEAHSSRGSVAEPLRKIILQSQISEVSVSLSSLAILCT